MIKALIIDDEQSGWEVLTELINLKHPEIELLPSVETVEDAIASIDTNFPELIFLDIKLGNDTGFDVLEKTIFKNYHVVFVTAYSQFALQAIKASAIEYLLKPIGIDELAEAIKKFRLRKAPSSQMRQFEELRRLIDESTEQSSRKLPLPTSKGYELLSINEILYLVADHNYTEFHLFNGIVKLATRTLGSFEEELTKNGFLRIHKSHMVNISKISFYEPGNGGIVKMTNGKRLEVSRRKKKELLQCINIENPRETAK